jgi:hypothetical protein
MSKVVTCMFSAGPMRKAIAGRFGSDERGIEPIDLPLARKTTSSVPIAIRSRLVA